MFGWCTIAAKAGRARFRSRATCCRSRRRICAIWSPPAGRGAGCRSSGPIPKGSCPGWCGSGSSWFYQALAEALASEHATRLAAMQNAERNIEERREELNAAYRRKRQETITRELLDVVSGFEAVGGEEGEAER